MDKRILDGSSNLVAPGIIHVDGVQNINTIFNKLRTLDAKGNLVMVGNVRSSEVFTIRTGRTGTGGAVQPTKSIVATKGSILGGQSTATTGTVTAGQGPGTDLQVTGMYKITIGKDCTNLQFLLRNTNGDLANSNPVDIKCAIAWEDLTDTTHTPKWHVGAPLNIGGVRTKTFAAGEELWTDVLAGTNFTKGQNLWFRYTMTVTTIGHKFPTNGYWLYNSNYEGRWNGADWCDNYAGDPSVAAASGGVRVPWTAGATIWNGGMFAPAATIGNEIGGPTPSVALVGDSITAGANDGQKIEANAFGWNARVCYDNNIPFVVVAKPGEAGITYGGSGIPDTNWRKAILPYCTDAIVMYGTNDLGAGNPNNITGTELLNNNIKPAWDYVASKGIANIYGSTIPPRTQAADWTTTVSNAYATGGGRGQFNDILRNALPSMLKGYFETADACEVSRDEGHWRTVNGLDFNINHDANHDGVHPGRYAHSYMAKTIDPRIFTQARAWEHPDAMPLTVPTGVTIKSGDQSASLQWNAGTDYYITGYNVYRDGAKVNTGLLTSPYFLDTGLTNAQTYSYEVTCETAWQRQSAKSSAVTTTPSVKAVAVSDTFTRADSPSSIGSVETGVAGQLAWSVAAVNQWEILGSKLRMKASSGNRHCWVETGQSDLDIEVKITLAVSQVTVIEARFADLNTHIACRFGPTKCDIYRNPGFVNIATSAANLPSWTVGSTYTLRVIAVDGWIRTYVDGVLYCTGFTTANIGNTKVGLSDASLGTTYDDLTVKAY